MKIRIAFALAAISMTLAGTAHASNNKQATELNRPSAANTGNFNSKTWQYNGDPNAKIEKPFNCLALARSFGNPLETNNKGKGRPPRTQE